MWFQLYSQKGLSKCKWTTRHFVATELFMGHSNFWVCASSSLNCNHGLLLVR